MYLVCAYSALSPSEEDSDYATSLVKEMRAEACTDVQICRSLAAKLVEGLSYGNWPSEMNKRLATMKRQEITRPEDDLADF